MFFEMVINKYISTELRRTCVNTDSTSDWAKLTKAGFCWRTLVGIRWRFIPFLFCFFFLPKTSACACQTPVKQNGNIFNLVEK